MSHAWCANYKTGSPLSYNLVELSVKDMISQIGPGPASDDICVFVGACQQNVLIIF